MGLVSLDEEKETPELSPGPSTEGSRGRPWRRGSHVQAGRGSSEDPATPGP